MYGSIVLSNNNLVGRLPSELGNLSNLYGLYLANNAGLTGTIPFEFGNMTGLRELVMFNNGMNGSVPEKLCEFYGNDKNFTRLEVDCDISCSCCDGFCF
jgi:Leucine-rich repeat (LRR) protein